MMEPRSTKQKCQNNSICDPRRHPERLKTIVRSIIICIASCETSLRTVYFQIWLIREKSHRGSAAQLMCGPRGYKNFIYHVVLQSDAKNYFTMGFHYKINFISTLVNSGLMWTLLSQKRV